MSRCPAAILLLALPFPLLSAPTPGHCTEIETGEIDGAPFRIQIPVQWNRCLVLYAHGYLPRGVEWSPMTDALSAVFLERGFAVAESGYSRQGWAVEEGLPETEALRQYFVEHHARPDSTFITGGSMGGLITIATIERYPDAYVGALPLCGPLVPAIAFFRDRMFDMLVTFESLFGESLPQESRPVVEVPGLLPEVIELALESDTDMADEFARHWEIRRGELPRMLAFCHLAYRELADRAGGNPIDNRNTVYAGPGPAEDLNDSVPRYAAEPRALEYVRRHYTPTGVIQDPVLALHTTYDPGVPPAFPNAYGVTVSLRGNEEWFVQKRVHADGHCNFAPSQIGRAFDELRTWAATGIRPEAGVLR